MNKHNYICALVLLLTIFLCADVYAAITGTVTDTVGSPVVGALVTFTDESNSENVFSDYTDKSGSYELFISPVLVDEDVPSVFVLGQNYPNPFNPTTTIPYMVENPGHVTLSIYNIMGQKIRTLINHNHSVGSYTVIWHGLDDNGRSVSSGIYIYQLKSRARTESKKMLLIDSGGVRSAWNVSNISITVGSMTKPSKRTDESTYRVTITGETIVTYEESGVIIIAGEPLNFVVHRFSEGLKLVYIPGGTFQMGDEVGDLPSDCTPVHTVMLDGFEMSTTEITNAQYATYLNEALALGNITATSSSVRGRIGGYPGFTYIDLASDCEINYSNGNFIVESGKENRPVIEVTWYGSKSFALYYGLDLPREAEWEYASRGGKQYTYGTDNGTIDQTKVNYNSNAGYTTDVGSYPANPFGLYDMSGNVWEWCNDWYGEYNSDSVTNPTGSENSAYRVFRGGCWALNATYCRTAYRANKPPIPGGNLLGFRVVRRSGGVIY